MSFVAVAVNVVASVTVTVSSTAVSPCFHVTSFLNVSATVALGKSVAFVNSTLPLYALYTTFGVAASAPANDAIPVLPSKVTLYQPSGSSSSLPTVSPFFMNFAT